LYESLRASGVPDDHFIEVGNAIDVLKGAGDDFANGLYSWFSLGDKELAVRQLEHELRRLTEAVKVISDL
jgi:membrane-bound inhibitor of C-type lysozyme